MSALISGVLKDGMGKPIPNCTIELKAERTSATVITKTIASQKPEENGSYSMNVEAGKYSVTLCVEGYPPNRVGEIYVHSESVPGTLNYYLGLPTEGDLPPAAIQQFEEMVALVAKQAAQVEKDKAAAAQSAADALASKNAAKTSETNANNSANDAAASAQAAKISETNAANSKKSAQASAADALASQNAAKASEIAANGSKVAAAQSAVDALASKNAAKASETNAGKSADGAAASAQAAKTSETSSGNSKEDAAQSAADALASKNAAKTSETNANNSANDAAASAQAAKISETNAANSKKSAQASAADALASQNAAKTSEDNAGASKIAAAQSAVTAKTEADRAAGALASKQDKSKILTDLSNSKDADGVREYLGLKETVNKAASALQDGSWGIGGNGIILKNVDLLSANGVGNTFFVQGGGTDNHFGSYGAGVHLSYGTGGGNTLRLSANLFVDPNGNLSVEWLEINRSDGAVRTQKLQKLYGTFNKPTARDVGAIPYFGEIATGTNLNTLTDYGIWFNPANANATPELNYPSWKAGSLLILRDAGCTQIYTEYASGLQFRRGLYMGAWSTWRVVYDSGNTTIDTNGFIKRASPIVKLFSDGSAELNSESEGVRVSRESVGVYRISGVLGMNSDGAWGGIDGGFDVPKDRNGQHLVWLDYEVDADGSILVKTYHRTYPDAPAFARNIKEGYEEGDLIDIPSDQFVSVRVEMPQDSIWNLAQKAAQEEMTQEQSAEE